MCIFSGRVRSVANTNIFTRLSGRGTQFLVYSMRYASDQPVAMILPLPVASPERRIGIRFINLKHYADFFNDMENGFPRPMMDSAGGSAMPMAAMAARPMIRVESVGDFIASYVPTLDDFDRLDPRFRLPRSTWDRIPVYRDYGFAVFQLKKTGSKGAAPARMPAGFGELSDGGDLGVHPMAFEFHTRLMDMLYFPTVHIHDEQVHPVEAFDHALYYQNPRLRPDSRTAQVSGPVTSRRMLFGAGNSDALPVVASAGPASGFMEWRKTQGVLDPNRFCFKMTLEGDLPNEDTKIAVA